MFLACKRVGTVKNQMEILPSMDGTSSQAKSYKTIGDILDFFSEVGFEDGNSLTVFPIIDPKQAAGLRYRGLESVVLYSGTGELLAVAGEVFARSFQSKGQGFWSAGVTQAQLAEYWRNAIELAVCDYNRKMHESEPSNDPSRLPLACLYRLLWSGTENGLDTGQDILAKLKHGGLPRFASPPEKYAQRYSILRDRYTELTLTDTSEGNHRGSLVFCNNWKLRIESDAADTSLAQRILLYNDKGHLEAAVLRMQRTMRPTIQEFWSTRDLLQVHLAKYLMAAQSSLRAYPTLPSLIPELIRGNIPKTRRIPPELLRLPPSAAEEPQKT